MHGTYFPLRIHIVDLIGHSSWFGLCSQQELMQRQCDIVGIKNRKWFARTLYLPREYLLLTHKSGFQSFYRCQSGTYAQSSLLQLNVQLVYSAKWIEKSGGATSILQNSSAESYENLIITTSSTLGTWEISMFNTIFMYFLSHMPFGFPVLQICFNLISVKHDF